MNFKLINELNHIISELKARDEGLVQIRELIKYDIIEFCEHGPYINDDGQIDEDTICELVDRLFNELEAKFAIRDDLRR